jgi:hypothetical protein
VYDLVPLLSPSFLPFGFGELPWWLSALLIFVLFLYVGGPLAVLGSLRARRNSTVLEIPLEEVPQPIRAQWYASAPALDQLGFEQPFWFRIDGPVGTMKNYLQLRFLPDGSTSIAQIGIMKGDGRLQTAYDEFMSHYSGDRTILTQNATALGSFAEVPEKQVVCFPKQEDLVALYRAHLKHQQLHRFGAPEPARREGIEDEIERSMRVDFERQVARGYFRVSDDGSEFQATPKGAVLMTWRQLPPWKTLQKMTRARRGRRVLAVDDSGSGGSTGVAVSISSS